MDDTRGIDAGAIPDPATTGSIFALGDLVPRIAPTAWIAPGAVVIGAVTVANFGGTFAGVHLGKRLIKRAGQEA